MIWYLRTCATKKRCIKCNKPIEKGTKVGVGFTPRWSVPKEVAELLYRFMSVGKSAKSIKRDKDTGEYYVSVPDSKLDIIFCGDCLGEFCEEYLGRLGSKIEITELH